MFTQNGSALPTPLRFVEDICADVILMCRSNHFGRIAMVSDSNTFPVAGNQLYQSIASTEISIQSIILSGSQLITDEQAVMSVLMDLDPAIDGMVAVGAGTITDIVRFIAHRKGINFISVPTAPSVDGYSSSGAPVIFRGYKRTVRCNPPVGVVASLSMLASAPHQMIAAGFGDVLGKATALADWKLAHIILDRPYDAAIAEDTRAAYRRTMDSIDGIAKHDPASIRVLFEALNTTGEAIRRFGSSDPASGSEHQISLLIEIFKHCRGLDTTLHGTKVALGTLVAADWYQRIRETTPAVIANLPGAVPDWEREAIEIRQLLGEAGERILESNDYLPDLTQARVSQIRKRLLNRWDEVQDIARTVPHPRQIASMLEKLGAPVRAEEIGISDTEMQNLARLSHYVRSRFTIGTLFFSLCIARTIPADNPVLTAQTDGAD